MEVDEASELFALPPAEFVRARDALATRLKADGRADEASEVKRLSRPTVVVWALNQLARQQPTELGELLDDAEAVRAAQQGGDAGGMRSATDRVQTHVTRLAAEAAAHTVEAGVAANPREAEIAGALRLAALSADDAPRLRAGTLTDVTSHANDLDMWSVGVGATGTAEKSSRQSDRRAEAARAAHSSAETALARAERDLAKAHERVDELRARLERETSQLTDLEAEVAGAEAEVVRRKAALDAADSA
jgi:hypothetical protein